MPRKITYVYHQIGDERYRLPKDVTSGSVRARNWLAWQKVGLPLPHPEAGVVWGVYVTGEGRTPLRPKARVIAMPEPLEKVA